MRNNKFKKLFSCILSGLLIAALTFMSGCNDNKNDLPNNNTNEVIELGEGETTFSFIVVDKDGNETEYEIHTDKTTVGDALLEHKLIEGEDGDYGLYVKSVNGIVADYNVDGTYWAFYVDGEYAMSGVEKTDIVEGSTYSFKVEK